jgi:hypothetical protein
VGVKANAATAAQNWQTGFSGAAQKYTDGVNAVTVAPGQLAAAQQQLYVQNVQAQAKVWAAKVGGVSLQDWKTAATTTGAARLATGATKGAPKMQQFMTNFLPALSSIVDSLPARGSFEQNLNRFSTYATALHQKKGQF